MHGNDIDKPEEGVLPSSSLKLSDDFMVVEPCSSRHVQIRECLLTCHGLATMPGLSSVQVRTSFLLAVIATIPHGGSPALHVFDFAR